MDRPTCKTCPYYEPGPDGGEKGECKRHAPRPVLGLVVDFEPYWPTVHREEWCGEHPDFPAYIRSLKADEPARGYVAASDIGEGQVVRFAGNGRVMPTNTPDRLDPIVRAVRDIAKDEVVPYDPRTGRLG